MPIRHATVASTDPVALYKILQLRTEVFIHEQQIIDEPETDGRDLEPTTTLFWLEEDGQVLATRPNYVEAGIDHLPMTRPGISAERAGG